MSAFRTKDATISSLMRTVIVIASVTLAAFILISWEKSNGLMDRSRDQQVIGDAMHAMADARFHIVEIQQLLTDVGASGDDAGFVDAEKELGSAMQSLDRLEALMPDLKPKAEEFRTGARELYDTGVRMANAYVQAGRPAGNAIMKAGGDGFDARSDALAAAMGGLMGSLEASLATATDTLNAEERSARMVVVGLSVALLAFLVLTSGILIAKVIPPLNRLLVSLRDMNNGNGDLSRRLSLQGSGEVGEIVVEFNRFLDQLQAIVADVSRSSTQLNKTAAGMLGVVSEAEKGMLKQHGEVMNVVTAMNEMSTTVQEIAHNAARAAEAAEQADEEALQSKQVVSLTKKTIGALAEEVEKATQVIHQLEIESDNIGTILDVIRDIADQTNLLALNAAIEAARAGEQGRGFAVVADEVRSLASRTQDSTQQIKAMIERLQAGANNAVKAMDSGRSQAHRSVQQAADAEGSLEVITAAVGTINEMNMQIASAAEEQSAVSSEINRNVHNISEVTEETAKGVKQSTELCGEVMEESRQLQAQISKFRL